jgi:hypothetical protein
MYREDTRRHIEEALRQILALGGRVHGLSLDADEALQDINLLSQQLGDQLWFAGYQLQTRQVSPGPQTDRELG